MPTLAASETSFRVRYAETDQMGVVYHSNYLVYFEMGRTDLCRMNGIRYRDMEDQDGVLLTVAEVECRYISAARYDEELVVRSCIAEANPRMVIFEYEIRSLESGDRIARGRTKHIFCNRALRPTRVPAKYYDLFGIVERGTRV